ncbi:hypothetical protein GCM10010124_05830 [Pilimelia terevasa]|uniref:YncI copper-binding domain-containing protein n=1 Tax=Pilimelia terevasa TaxID=53372 RepID=A0A8J3FHW3_9ACTN|nr:DUF1775 domain-containing protein [Pilimelia terevasa]GGK16057.1 hypothetical protein GCM10010124_05830 [Pilimelia terevasa]
MLRLRSALPAVLLAASASAGAVLLAGGPALAHVTVSADKPVQGGFARVGVRVPNESATARTVKLEVTLPTDQPIASVATQPVPGWTAAAVKGAPAKPVNSHGREIKEVVTKITWTAVGAGGVAPGEFQEFPVSMGPLPHADQLVFKAVQTYSDGTVARWIQESAAGAEEPENPAPVLRLAAAAEGDEHGDGAAKKDDHDKSSGSGAALGFGIAGLALGIVGAVLGGLALARTRRSTPAA